MRLVRIALLGTAILSATAIFAFAQEPKPEACPRPEVGSVVPEPVDLRSQNGVLRVELTYRTFRDDHGQTRYCYLDRDRNQAPTLRVNPGDWLILSLKNEASFKNEAAQKNDAVATSHPSATSKAVGRSVHSAVAPPPCIDLVSLPVRPAEEHEHPGRPPASDARLRPLQHVATCAGGAMQPASTNLHFHGLTVPSTCHQDDVLHTLIEAGSPAYEYRFRIPGDEPPGLCWYHPHVHGATKAQVLGGASGALIVEGIERGERRRHHRGRRNLSPFSIGRHADR